MLTTKNPSNWQQLQEWVGQILAECGMIVEIEKTIETVRGAVEIDVYAEETFQGRKNVILCECKHWKQRVPKNVIHGFRSVMSDFGANIGYIISSSGFQSGSLTAAQLTNIQLVTWPEFQTTFEATWVQRYLMPVITEQLDPLMTFVEPLYPNWVDDLPAADKVKFQALVQNHFQLGVLAMSFSKYSSWLGSPPPNLPVANLVGSPFTPLPKEVTDALGFRDLLDACLEQGSKAIAEFRELRDKNGLHGGE